MKIGGMWIYIHTHTHIYRHIHIHKHTYTMEYWASQVALVVKNPPANAGDLGSIPGLGRSLGGGHGNPLQYSCLENAMDTGAWTATVQRVTQSWI